MAKTVTVELKTALPYAHKGDEVAGGFVELSCFSMKQMHLAAPLKQMVVQAFMDAQKRYGGQEGAEAKDAGDISGAEVMAILYAAEVDIAAFVGHMRELLTSGVALVDGEEKLTKPLLDALDPADFESVAGAYVVNFMTT